MHAIAQAPLLDAGPANSPTDRTAVAPQSRPSERRRAPGGHQMRLRLVPRPDEAPAAALDPRTLAHAAARTVAGPEQPLVELHLHGERAWPAEHGPAGARGVGAGPDALLLVAPCAAGADGLDAFDGRTVIFGRGGRAERLAGRVRLDGPWLWLTRLGDDGPERRLPRADARVWGEVVTIVRPARRGAGVDRAGARAS